MDKLRLSERTAENQQGDRKAFYGLMPASISHEGYSAKPMHSYWDDFWALAGYESAVRIARALEQKTEMHALHRIARPVPRAICIVSLSTAMQAHNIDYLPGAAELGDFDATSTTIALSPVGEQQLLPPRRWSPRSSGTGRISRRAAPTRAGMPTRPTSGATWARSSACAGATAAWS